MITTLIIDGYQTCIKTGEDDLAKAMEKAYGKIPASAMLPPFFLFLEAYQQVVVEIEAKTDADSKKIRTDKVIRSRDINDKEIKDAETIITKAILIDERVLLEKTFEKMNVKIPKEIINELADRKWTFFSESVSLYPDVLVGLRELSQRYNLILCVDGCEKYEQQVMDKLSLTPFFDRIITTDKIGLSKENPSAWNVILKELCCLKEEVLVLDDRPKVLLAAEVAGLRTVRVRRGKYRNLDNITPPDLEVDSLLQCTATSQFFSNQLTNFLNNAKIKSNIIKSNIFRARE